MMCGFMWILRVINDNYIYIWYIYIRVCVCDHIWSTCSLELLLVGGSMDPSKPTSTTRGMLPGRWLEQSGETVGLLWVVLIWWWLMIVDGFSVFMVADGLSRLLMVVDGVLMVDVLPEFPVVQIRKSDVFQRRVEASLTISTEFPQSASGRPSWWVAHGVKVWFDEWGSSWNDLSHLEILHTPRISVLAGNLRQRNQALPGGLGRWTAWKAAIWCENWIWLLDFQTWNSPNLPQMI